MSIQAVCFDLDDTLFDYHEYAEAGLRSAADLLEARTGECFHEELLALYFDEDVTEGTFDRLLDRHDLPSHLLEDLVEAYHDAAGSLSAYPETESVLSELTAEYRLGLVTDGRGGHAKLDRLGIREYFDAVVVTPTIGRTKHDAMVFERVLSDLDVPPADAVYVGDDPRVDFRVPNDLGMTTVRIRRGRFVDLEPVDAVAAPDHEITRLDRLPGCL